jgi:hypothetical protein
MTTANDLPPLITISAGARLAGQSRWAFRRWLRDRCAVRDHEGKLRYPDLVQKSGNRWLVQVESLGQALGRTRVDLERLTIEVSNRTDDLELRVGMLEKRVRGG